MTNATEVLKLNHWQDRLADQVQISIKGSRKSVTSDSSEWDGTYLVQLSERSEEKCLWEGEIPGGDRWQRLEIEAIRGDDGRLHVHVGLLGDDVGPCWSGSIDLLPGHRRWNGVAWNHSKWVRSSGQRSFRFG
jgi:hypothetical protein